MWKRLYLAQDIILAHLRVYCPVRTGNLAATITPDNNSLVITIGNENIQYAPYTNEAYKDGRVNKNEGWIDRAIEASLPIVERFLAGAVSEEEVTELVKAHNTIWQDRLDAAAEKFKEEAIRI